MFVQLTLHSKMKNFVGYARSVHFQAYDDGNFIGEFQLRLELADDIMLGMGSMGYSVRVTEWDKGYKKEILKQGLDKSLL